MNYQRLSAGKRKPVNLSIDANVVVAARELGINLSLVSEAALREATKAEMGRRWKEENKAAFDYWNDWLEENGLPLADLRLW